MLVSDLVRALAQGVSALLLVSGNAHVWQLVVLQAIYGAAEAFFKPAAQALLPETVAAADLQQANALIAVSGNIANIGGPALAGVLVATLGAGWGLAIDAGSFLASAAYLSLMRVQAVVPAARTGTLSELRAGWRAFRSRTWLWVSALEFMAANAFAFSPYLVLGPQIARTSLGGPGAWAAISTASGIGAFLGGALGLRWNPRYPLRAMFLTSIVGTTPLLVLLAAAAPLPALLAAAVLSGIAISFFNLVWFAVVQRRIPGKELSRVSSWTRSAHMRSPRSPWRQQVPSGLRSASPRRSTQVLPSAPLAASSSSPFRQCATSPTSPATELRHLRPSRPTPPGAPRRPGNGPGG